MLKDWPDSVAIGGRRHLDFMTRRERREGVMRKWVFRVFFSFHVFLYRLTDGRIGGNMAGNPILLLHTTGRKSGKSYLSPLTYYFDNGRYVIMASNWGEEHHPGWYYNLISRPQATIQVMGELKIITAEEVSGEDRQRLWSAVTASHPQYLGYQEKMTRQMPFVALTEKGSDS